jgi:hypothetical protein
VKASILLHVTQKREKFNQFVQDRGADRFSFPTVPIDGHPNSPTTCHLPETESSLSHTDHKEFIMTTTHFDQLQLAER